MLKLVRFCLSLSRYEIFGKRRRNFFEKISALQLILRRRRCSFCVATKLQLMRKRADVKFWALLKFHSLLRCAAKWGCRSVVRRQKNWDYVANSLAIIAPEKVTALPENFNFFPTPRRRNFSEPEKVRRL